MRRLAPLLALLALAACQGRSMSTVGHIETYGPLDRPPTIVEESRIRQGGSFGTD